MQQWNILFDWTFNLHEHSIRWDSILFECVKDLIEIQFHLCCVCKALSVLVWVKIPSKVVCQIKMISAFALLSLYQIVVLCEKLRAMHFPHINSTIFILLHFLEHLIYWHMDSFQIQSDKHFMLSHYLFNSLNHFVSFWLFLWVYLLLLV